MKQSLEIQFILSEDARTVDVIDALSKSFEVQEISSLDYNNRKSIFSLELKK